MLQGQGGPVQTPTLNVTVPYLMVTFGNFQSELYQKCPGPPLSSLLQKMMLGPQFSLNSANSARHEDFVQMVEHVCTLVWVQGAHTPSSLFPKQFLSFWLLWWHWLRVCHWSHSFRTRISYFHIIRMISIVLGALK